MIVKRHTRIYNISNGLRELFNMSKVHKYLIVNEEKKEKEKKKKYVQKYLIVNEEEENQKQKKYFIMRGNPSIYRQQRVV